MAKKKKKKPLDGMGPWQEDLHLANHHREVLNFLIRELQVTTTE